MIVPAHLALLPDGVSPMVLRSTLTSPYGRKVRMAAHCLALTDLIKVVPADSLDPEDDLRLQNPLGKMPCLLVGPDIFFDSRVILEFFDNLAGGGRLFPETGLSHYRLLTQAALADGITDAALLMTYESRFRNDAQVSEYWLSHQRGKIERGLTRMVDNPPDPQRTDAASISFACTLGYLDWRRHTTWRHDYPALVAWLDAFAAAEPAFDATRNPFQ